MIILIDSYPLYLLLLSYISFKIFHFNRLIAAALPLIVLTGYIYLAVQYLIPGLADG
jgi:hypothetical protein